MLRVIAVAYLMLGVSASLKAAEVCVACDKPVATYRCTLEKPTRDSKIQFEDAAAPHICETVLAKLGPHGSCRIVDAGVPCDGVPRVVTITDYQRAMAGDGETTYQVGVFELARQKVYATFVCVASLFNDC